LLEELVQGGLDFGGVNTLAGGVADMKDDIRYSVIVERAVVFRQVELPGALGAGALKREKPFLTQVRLEHAAIVLTATGHDRLHSADIVDEAIVLGALPRVFAVLGER